MTTRACLRTNPYKLLLRMAAVLLACTLLPAGGCNPSDAPPAEGTPAASRRVVAVSYPLQYLTQRITGDAVEVEFPVPASADPTSWRPDRQAIQQIQAADLVIANSTGATYANWLTTVSISESKLCQTATRGLALSDYIAVEDVQIVHSHGPEGEHSHPTMVARTWLAPPIAKKQAAYIADRLTRLYPDLADQFATNLKSLNLDLDDLDAQLKTIAANDHAPLLLATPQGKFFARASGVPDRHLTWFAPPGLEQARTDLQSVFDDLQDSKPNLILFDNVGPAPELENLLAEKGLQIIVLNLIDHRPETGDYLTAMKENIRRLVDGLK